jgi:hypothetical protein
MLIAWGRGKKGRDYAGYEDEIVSAVFGHLSYFEAAQRNKVFQTILNHAFNDSAASELANKKIKSCDIQFWPNIAKEGRIEPDILVELLNDDGSRSALLIEAKWNSGQHEGQLGHQWNAARKLYETVLHIYLTKDPHSFEKMKIEHLGHQDHLVNLTWSRLALVLLKIAKDRPIEKWAKDVGGFLSEVGEAAFIGFNHIADNHMGINEVLDKNWYFQPALMRISNSDDFVYWTSTVSIKAWKFKNNSGDK